ncbi:helix-turn-helix domain-containing protein, partial [Candidatus Ventrimonas sp. KK005]
VLDLWNQGYSISKIARVLSLSRPTVYNRLDKLVELGALKKDYREQRREERSNCVHPKKESDKDDFVSINLRL